MLPAPVVDWVAQRLAGPDQQQAQRLERTLVQTLDILEELGGDNDTLVAAIAYDLSAGDVEHEWAKGSVENLIHGQAEAEKVWSIYQQRRHRRPAPLAAVDRPRRARGADSVGATIGAHA